MKHDTVRNREAGFTLLELLISCLLTLLIAGLCYQSIFTLNSARHKFQRQTALIQQKQLTHRTFSKLLADATSIRIYDTEIKFTVISENGRQNTTQAENIIKFDASGKRLLHVEGDQQTLLVSKVDSVSFSTISQNTPSNSDSSSQHGQPFFAHAGLPDALAVSLTTDLDSWNWQFNREVY